MDPIIQQIAEKYATDNRVSFEEAMRLVQAFLREQQEELQRYWEKWK